MKFFKTHEDAVLPTRGSEEAACYDLSCIEDFTLYAHQRNLFATGVGIEMCKGEEGTIKPRSKLANKFGIDVLAGQIDSDYRGEIKVILINHGTNAVEFKAGDKIAQLRISNYVTGGSFWIDNPSETKRGSEGIDSLDERR